MATARTVVVTQLIRKADQEAGENFNRDKRIEPQYKFRRGKRIFVAETNKTGPYSGS